MRLGKNPRTSQEGPFGEVTRRTGDYAAGNPFQFSTKYSDAETGLAYYGYRYYQPSAGRWLSRDPLEEDGGINLLGFVFNSPIGLIDTDGAQPRQNFGPRRLDGASQLRPYTRGDGNPFTALRLLWGIPWSILSGDVFDKKGIVENLQFGTDKCSVTITINGIWNNNTVSDYLRDSAGQSARFSGGALVRVQNGTHWIIGDLLQILGNELWAIDVTADRAATQINIAYVALKKNGCACGVMKILAHSQGAMVLARALPMVDPRARSLLCITTIGGEKALVRNPHIGRIENFRNINDWIPQLGNEWNPLRLLDIPQVLNGYDMTILHSPHPASTEHGYRKHYEQFINGLPSNCELRPVK